MLILMLILVVTGVQNGGRAHALQRTLRGMLPGNGWSANPNMVCTANKCDHEKIEAAKAWITFVDQQYYSVVEYLRRENAHADKENRAVVTTKFLSKVVLLGSDDVQRALYEPRGECASEGAAEDQRGEPGAAASPASSVAFVSSVTQPALPCSQDKPPALREGQSTGVRRSTRDKRKKRKRQAKKKKKERKRMAEKQKRRATLVNEACGGGFIDLPGRTSANAKVMDCMQAAMLIGAELVGRPIARTELYAQVPPQKDQYTTVKQLLHAPCVQEAVLTKWENYAQCKGGPERSLLEVSDGKPRLVVLEVDNRRNGTTTGKEYSMHAVIFSPHPLRQQRKPHVGALIDNRGMSAARLVEHSDRSSAAAAHQCFNTFLHGEKCLVKTVYRLEKNNTLCA